MPTCGNCGGEEFELNDGLYYCTECHVQSQDLREVVLDDEDEGGQHTSAANKIRQRISHRRSQKMPTDADVWSLYELYNIIIKRQVDALISLGANPMLKNAVFHLWSSYLKKSNVAFLNLSTESRIPRFHFPLGYCRRREAEIALNVSALSSRRKSDKQVEYFEKKRKKGVNLMYKKYGYMRKGKKKKRQKKSDATSSDVMEDHANSACSDSDFGYLSESSIASTMSVASSSRTDHVILKKTRVSTCLSAIGKSFQEKGKNAMSYSAQHNVWHMKLSRTLSFLYLGLLLINDHILLYDIIRWVRSGKIPLYRISHLFPDNVHFKNYEKSLFTMKTSITAISVKTDCDKLAKKLHVKGVVGRHSQLICARLVRDLNLPNEICALANVLISYQEMAKKENKKKTKQSIPFYEAHAMAVLIICLKMMFGLDGITELNLSKFAKHLNGEFNDCESFVWSDWVKFTKLRQTIAKLSPYNCNKSHGIMGFNDDVLGNFHSCDTSLFGDQFSEIQHSKKMKSFAEAKQSMLASMSSVINSTQTNAVPQGESSFPASFQVAKVLQKWSEVPAVEDKSTGDMAPWSRLLSPGVGLRLACLPLPGLSKS